MRYAVALVALAFVVATPVAQAAHPRTDRWDLHPGSRGPRVAGLQWMLSGHRPNAYTPAAGGKVKPTLRAYTRGVYGARTKSAVIAYRYRLGFPAQGQCGARASKLTAQVGPWFFALLQGRVQRPICWVALAQQRVKLVEPGATQAALRIKAFELTQLGAAEQPPGSNCGPVVSTYMTFFGYRCGYQWCAFFQNYSFAHAGYKPIPFPSGNPWYVPAIAAWAQQHGWLNAKARVGSLVAFLTSDGRLVDAYHIGYVTKVLASGYVDVSGNYGDRVAETFHPFTDRLRVFIDLPGVA